MEISPRITTAVSDPTSSKCSAEPVREKLRTLKTKIQAIKADAMSDSTIMQKLKEMKKLQEDMKEQIAKDSQQVRLLEQVNQQVFKTLEKYLNIKRQPYLFGYESRRDVFKAKEENFLEFNFDFDAFLQGLASDRKSLQKDGNDNGIQHGILFREHAQMSRREIEVSDGNEMRELYPASDTNERICDARKYLDERKDEDGKTMFIDLVKTNPDVHELWEVCTEALIRHQCTNSAGSFFCNSLHVCTVIAQRYC